MICECDPFFFLCICVENICCALDIILFLKLWILCNGNSLFMAIVSCLACFVIGSAIILCIYKMKAANFCSDGLVA